MSKNLFITGDLSYLLQTRHMAAVNTIQHLDRDQFNISSDDQLLEYALTANTIAALELFPDQAVMEPREGKQLSSHPELTHVVDAVFFDIEIPFTGDAGLFGQRPSAYRNYSPLANIHVDSGKQGGTLTITISVSADASPEEVKRLLSRELEHISFYTDQQRNDIKAFEKQQRAAVKKKIANRRETLARQDGLVRALDIPLKKNPSAPSVMPIKTTRQLVKPLPTPPQSGYKPEWSITDAVYQHILEVIRHEGRSFETAPRTFAKFDEEGLRDILLAHLNGHYKGEATAETFRKKGKTDIRIEADDRAAFVAECKIWYGPNGFERAIDQLLGYLTWRDCKCSLIIFNKENKGISGIIRKMSALLREHPQCQKEVDTTADGEWRTIYRQENDEGRQIQVHTFLFNLYTK